MKNLNIEFQDQKLYTNLDRTIDFFSNNLPPEQRTADLADSPLKHATLLAMLTASLPGENTVK